MLCTGGRVLKMVTEMGSATIGGISPALSANAAKSFIEATDKEKKTLQVNNWENVIRSIDWFILIIDYLLRDSTTVWATTSTEWRN